MAPDDAQGDGRDPRQAPGPVATDARATTFPDAVALRGRAAFGRLRREGRRIRRGTITVTWAAGDLAEPPRVAYAVGRHVGGAVVRNRIRRRLRAIIREIGAELVPGDYLVGAGADAATLPYGELRATVSEALRAVTRRP